MAEPDSIVAALSAEETPETPTEETPTPGAEEATPTEEVTPPVESGEEEAPPEPGDEETPPEPGTEEEAPAEETPEQAAEKLAQARAAAEEKTLTEFYRESPQLKEFLKQSGNEKLRFAFFRAAEINKEFVSVADAKQAKQDALVLAEIDANYLEPGIENKEKLLDWLADQEERAGADEQGHYADLLHVATNRYVLGILDSAKEDPTIIADAAKRAGFKPDEFHAMLQCVAFGLGLKGVTLGGKETAAGAKGGEPDPRFAREREEFQREKTEFEKARQQEFNAGIQKEMKSWLDTFVSDRMKPATALTKNPGLSQMVAAAVRNEILKQLDADKMLDARIKQLTRSGKRGPELHQKIVAQLQQRIRTIGPQIVTNLLREAGFSVVSAAKEKDAKRNEAAAHREPSSTGSPGRNSAARPAPTKPGGYVSRSEQVDLVKEAMGE